LTVSAIILAAGRSSRFEDGHKLLVEIDGVPIVRHVCRTIAETSIDEILLVVAHANDPVAIAAGPGRWRTVENPEASQGLSTSLLVGLKEIADNADGALVALADMPGITPALVSELLSAFSANRTSIVYPVSEDQRRGHPIIWPKSLFAELAGVTGDVGGKSVLSANQHLWFPVPCQIAGAFVDIDTRADLQAFDQTTRRR
jgi:molybdenum cofactor cytidylyltransferase